MIIGTIYQGCKAISLKAALCRFGDEIPTQNFNIFIIIEAIIQTLIFIFSITE